MTDSFDRYLAIYKLGCHWEIDAAKEYAKTWIDSQEPTNEEHIKMLQFSRQHHVDDWFASSFQNLVDRNMTTFTTAESEKIGLETLLVIAKTRDARDQHRRHIARLPPPIQHSVCCPQDERAACTIAYEDLWWKIVGRSLLDPKYGIPTTRIPELVGRVVATDMNPKCWEKTKRDIVTHRYDECLRGEEWIIEQVLERLRKKDEAIDAINLQSS